MARGDAEMGVSGRETTAKQPRRLLIVLFGAIGDVVRGLPLAQRLHAVWPECRIAWAVEPPAAALLRGHPAIDTVFVFDRRRGARAFPSFLREVRAWRADVSVDLQRHIKSGVTSWCSGAPRRLAFHWRNSREGNRLFANESIPPVTWQSPKLEHFLLFADTLGAPPAPLGFGLVPSSAERRRAAELLAGVGEPFAVFFVGASWPTKLWHREPAAAVIDALAERRVATVLVGGPGDAALAREVLAASRHGAVDLVGQTGLRELLAVFERAAVAFGPDSGPMHMAAAVGLPVVGLFGATSPARSAAHGFADLVVEGDAPCRPCYARRCPIDRACMRAIAAERVLEMIEIARKRGRTRREG
jgi:ADP-heptose:LPS heptosyltransferase